MQRFIYVSHASDTLDFSDLGDIAKVSKDLNARDGITGLLLWADGAFIQLIEGPKTELDDLISRITADSRHSGMIHLAYREIEQTICDTWGMGCFPVPVSQLPSAFLGARNVATILQRFNAMQDKELIAFFQTFYERNIINPGWS